ncbi:MAG TPA: protein kinase family protein [Pseudonocardiaceae bacterium]|jgi:hypothetical protein|nr:protein kinase family protein [Pseudonocardiaceae bacterium]
MRFAPDDVFGRYRLVAACGGDDRTGLQFWHARDVTDGHDVALTVLPDQPAVARHVRVGERYVATVTHPALAPVTDLEAGLIAAEWLPSVDIGDAVLGAHLPVRTVVGLLRPLVDAVEAAHHAGVPAGIDSPGRVRIAEHGGAFVAFRGVPPDTTTRDDVRALGAVTYLLLSGCWPVADRDGHLVDPTVLRPDAPRDLATVAALSLDPSLGPDIRTCGPLLRALDQALVPPPPPEPPREPEPVRERHTPGRPQFALAAAVVVVALAVVFGIQFAGSFGVASPSASAPSTTKSTTTTRSPTTTVTTTTTTPPPPPKPVSPATVREFVVSGSADNPGTLSRVADGDPGTTWQTDTYRQQFPLYSPGIGILARFGKPLASVTITSPTTGTVVELRSAAAPDVSLDDTGLLTTAALHAGANTVDLPAHRALPYLLVWIVRLDQTEGGFQSQIAEITGQPVR